MLPRSRRYCCIIGVSASRMIPELNHAARIASLNWSKRLNGTAVFMTGKSAPRWDIQFFESRQGLGRISSKNQPMQQMITTSLTPNQPAQTSATNGSTPLIRLTDLSKIFVTDEVETHAVSGVHLDVRDGEYVSIAGPSGCGKTTLLSILGLLDTPSDGSYVLKGTEVANLSFADRARIRNREIGFIFQSFNLIGDLTVYENVELPLTYRGLSANERKSAVMGALERVGMVHRARHLPGQLSGGQQQRVAVARALAGKPAILLADEPTGNLDSRSGEAVMDLLKELHGAGATICMVTHDYRQFSHTEYLDLRENGGDLFADLAALEFAVAGTGRDHEMRRSFAFLTSENFFSLIGLRPVRGRFYTAEECRPNANVPVVVASYAFWKRMGGRNDFVGSNLQINGQPYAVIGITPDGFSGVSALVAPDIWLPLGVHSRLGSAFADSESLHDLAEPKNYALNLTARLRPGLTIETAKARLAPLTQRFNAIQPSNTEGARDLQLHEPSRFSISTSPEDDGPVTLIGALLMGMAGAVLLIASLNLANMLLARGTARSKEIALRLAVGASRWRIVRQLLCEGLLLAICGGLVGLVMSVWCNDLLLHSLARLLGSTSFSFVVKLRPALTVLGVTFLFCLIATVLFSLGPALKATRADLVSDLKQQIGEPARIGRFNRFFAARHISVMAQIALSLMLLFSAGLFFRGALKASGLNPGFVAAGDLVTEMDFSLIRKDPAEARRLIFEAVRRARDLPGVRTAALGTMLPYGNFTNSRRIMSMRETLPTDPKAPDPGAGALFTATTPGYFDAIGVKLLRGRDFTEAEAETKNTPRVAIIDDEMAKKIFP